MTKMHGPGGRARWAGRLWHDDEKWGGVDRIVLLDVFFHAVSRLSTGLFSWAWALMLRKARSQHASMTPSTASTDPQLSTKVFLEICILMG